MSEPRTFPALVFPRADYPADDDVDRLLAEVDEAGPIGIDHVADDLRVFFMTREARDWAARLVASGDPPISARSEDVPDEGWAERSQASLGAVRVGRIVVAPPWVPREPDGLWIEILPSMGFGTGHHESTRLCLSLLQECEVHGRSAIDIGTGSGVLALAAWRLGASGVRGFDYDPDAVACAMESVTRNGAQGTVRVAQLDLHDKTATSLEPADVVLANLTGDMLRRTAPLIARLVRAGGTLIVSGVLDREADDVVAAFEREGFVVGSRRSEGEWVGMRLASQ